MSFDPEVCETDLFEATDFTRGAEYEIGWSRSTGRVKQIFMENEFGHKCDVCDRLWFLRDLKTVTSSMASFLSTHFPEDDTTRFRLCSSCYSTSRRDKVPPMSMTNGYRYPPKPSGLPKLDPISERLVSPRIPYMQIRRLRRDGCHGIVGQVINVPVDVNTMVQSSPRSLDDYNSFNVNLKKSIIVKCSYLSGSVKKSTVKAWLVRYQVKSPMN
ncbi:uncharacterized protein LOC114828288 [Galendromus occidentalis]|uniref:Uncharacterized protein LOC114828288 n=1 Tax=Galendromus occidentalis TaxID=34638 RepID=A0AAJ7SFN2_9ACAR|nr:uncharacterized protein LOC114828288 [Galendromus occidentalis]